MKKQKSHRNIVLLSLSLLAMMTVAVIYSPTLYQLFCAATGYGGTVRRVADKPLDTQGTAEKITVRFDANVSPGLDWEFRPEQRELVTNFDKPTKAYFYARNNSNETVVARATFNITPYQAASYFFKVQCFCFTEERLEPGESARMPLVLYIDKEMLKDEVARNVHEITLSYTFFKQNNLTPAEIEATRDLSGGSLEQEQDIKSAKTADFANDAPRN
jgi:cytochrome c oxidase assembly protein subunit 11